MEYSWAQFRCCPKCGEEYRPGDFHRSSTSFRCGACQYEFFQNSSPASTAVLGSRAHPTDVVLLTRAMPPGEGLLGLPGGFLHYRESPAEGVLREVHEEIGVRADIDRLLESYLVDYTFRGAIVSVVELVFLCKPIDVDVATIQTSEARSVGYYDVREVLERPSRLAFPEQQQALRRYRDHVGF